VLFRKSSSYHSKKARAIYNGSIAFHYFDLTFKWNNVPNKYIFNRLKSWRPLQIRHLWCWALNDFKIQIKCLFVNPRTCTDHIYKNKLNISRFEKKNHIAKSIKVDVEICFFFFKTDYIKILYIIFIYMYMISICAGIDKYTFYLDFKVVLSSTPQVSVLKIQTIEPTEVVL
jgi:hypothetical protein